ncbi:MAG: hypothetical protein K0S16_617 [Moraxellaceae bacterium]|nr:hypothetical protein [Moraxellaceae bacterium]
MTSVTMHTWRFFRAGGFDQVQIDTPADLAALRTLDQKLWAALACPVDDLEFDKRTLQYINDDNDGRVRAPELVEAVEWTLARLADPAILFRNEPLALSALKDDDTGQRLRATARHLLALVGKPGADSVSVDDTADLEKIFPPDKPNGDGLIPPDFTVDESLRAVITDIIACMGAEKDRGGTDAVSEAKVREFFVQAEQVHAWFRRGDDSALQPFGATTAGAMQALEAVREKIDDYFHRVALADFDPRAAALMNGEEAELVKLAARNLSRVEEAASLPLAVIHHGERLPLARSINPGWRRALQEFRAQVVTPLLGEREHLTVADWDAITQRAAPYRAWQGERPALAILEKLTPERVAWMVENDYQEKLLDLIAQDRAVATEADSLIELDKLLRFQKNLVTLLNNFVSFRDFYTRRAKAVFQAGTLYIDGKSCDLVARVGKIEDHAKMANGSGSFLLYCECRRRTPGAAGQQEKMNIVAAVTAGDEGNLMLGRNGLFYDRDGVDWDAQVVKMIQNAISVREAFWLPYRRIARLISEQIQKITASHDQSLADKASARLTAATQGMEPGDEPVVAVAEAPRAPFDIAKFAGVFAAIGLAVGALGTAAATVMAGLLSLHWWQMPLALFGVILLLSGPSMVLAWFKLRRRNLAPILDASGWAVNTRARINIGFGTALTQLATLPPGSARSLRDPYAKRRAPWVWLTALLLVAILALAWVWQRDGWLTWLF